MSFDPDALPVPDLGLKCMACDCTLAGLSEHRCRKCGRRFTLDEYLPPGDFPLVVFAGKPVRMDDEIAAFMRGVGIPVLERRTSLDAMRGMDTRPNHAGELRVPRESYYEVIDLLRRRASGERIPIVGSPGDCPEWTCRSCDEPNPGQFEICWNCGEELHETA